jgi:succinate-semialdehyde dehydrogenase/glutarate-semialdehyde dehydrogenase
MTSAPSPPGTKSELSGKLLIGGEWTEGSTGRTARVYDPASGTLLGHVALAEVDDCLRAVEAAQRALPDWASRAPRERAELLRSAFDLLRAERDDIAEMIVRENGKAWADAAAEADYAIEFFRWYGEEAVRIEGDLRTSPSGDKRILVTRQPVGVSLLITPWNFPAAMATRKLAPALAAGCSVVLKPALETPFTALRVVAALERAGIPQGVVNVVFPDPPGPASRAMLGHPAVRKLSFTGSTEVGRHLLREAADTVVSSSMELGGNAPFIVLDGACVDEAVEGAFTAKMRNGGAACTAANRFYVVESLVDEFTEKLVARMSEVTIGPGLDRANQLGSCVSEAEKQKIAELIEKVAVEGCSVITCGSVPQLGSFIAPTVIRGVAAGSSIIREEIFGPVAPVISCADEDEATTLANETEMGLVGYVYGPMRRALRVAERLEVGMVGINRAIVSDPAAPFGGVKQSGLGREGGHEGIEEFLEIKYMAVEW